MNLSHSLITLLTLSIATTPLAGMTKLFRSLAPKIASSRLCTLPRLSNQQSRRMSVMATAEYKSESTGNEEKQSRTRLSKKALVAAGLTATALSAYYLHKKLFNQKIPMVTVEEQPNGSMSITMPNAETLKKYFARRGLGDFVEKTKFDNQLEGRQSLSGIERIIRRSCKFYTKQYSTHAPRDKIILAINDLLKDSPNAIEKLNLSILIGEYLDAVIGEE